MLGVIGPVSLLCKHVESAVGSFMLADVDFHIRLGPVDLYDQNSPSSNKIKSSYNFNNLVCNSIVSKMAEFIIK